MYKLFLTFRYLTRKKIVIFPILAIWLCVMMMIIVASIMGGFVDRAQQVNRDLNGDIIVTGSSLAGWPHYDEFGAALQQKFPDILDWTPAISGYGLINTAGTTRGVQIVGVNPVGRSKVCNFRQTLYRQYQAPIQAADDLAALGLPKTGLQLLQAAEKASTDATDQRNQIEARADKALDSPAPTRPYLWALLGLALVIPLAFLTLGRKHRRTVWTIVSASAVLLVGTALVALVFSWPLIFPAAATARINDAREQADLKADRAYRTALLAADLLPTQSYSSKSQILAVLLPKEPSFAVPAEADARFGGAANTPQDACYVGADLMAFRDQRGNFHHNADPDYIKVILTVVPVSTRGSLGGASQKQFVITDDFYTGVFEVDKQDVYASFDVVQDMAGMRSDAPKDSPNYFPPRCNDILLKLKPGQSIEQMENLRRQISQFIDQFIDQHPDVRHLEVLTWQDQQKTYLDAVRQEKVMMAFILLLMSGVVIVVIFLIFYMLVRDKTRDIGIIKAVGGSEEGVAQIFLSYGLFVGLVGGILGVISGVAFVHHTNQIHDFIFQLTGHMIWDRKVYVFDRIPDTVNPTEVAVYFTLALVAAFLGALIPALVAGSEDPVKAVRYE